MVHLISTNNSVIRSNLRMLDGRVLCTVVKDGNKHQRVKEESINEHPKENPITEEAQELQDSQRPTQ